ncbi:LysR substrate-binding domain-containing protein, partial [Jannaschia aquimarina]|uniref:LysR substrate-binding domain-containing protein n=1 Tax=Jannaschia aquimarina TaxID=935700 RepID=UPI0037098B6D
MIFEPIRTPSTPAEPARHRRINLRRPTQKTNSHWRVVQDGEDGHVPVSRRVLGNDPNAKVQAARAGLGFAHEIDRIVRPHLDRGTLVSVLNDHLPQIQGLHICHAGRARIMRRLRVFIDFARLRSGKLGQSGAIRRAGASGGSEPAALCPRRTGGAIETRPPDHQEATSPTVVPRPRPFGLVRPLLLCFPNIPAGGPARTGLD